MNRTYIRYAVLFLLTAGVPGSGCQPATVPDSSAAPVSSSTSTQSDSSARTSLDEIGTSPDEEVPVASWQQCEDLPQELALLPTVFWEPQDTESLRKLIKESGLTKNRRILEIGTGSGLIALCCLHNGAAQVTATDINPNAVRCARLNAQRLGFSSQLDCRLVSPRSPDAWYVIGAEERFDLIISNPPWENRTPASLTEYALYDPEFSLLRSLISDAESHLKPRGRILLAYGCVSAVRTVQKLADDARLTVRILDDRKLDQLPETFLPGMLIELTPPATQTE